MKLIPVPGNKVRRKRGAAGSIASNWMKGSRGRGPARLGSGPGGLS